MQEKILWINDPVKDVVSLATSREVCVGDCTCRKGTLCSGGYTPGPK